ncbi:MAG: hypothetical protein HQK53_03375 [Oligoflexia bacterium]|nr:hypothetical protein [Oligoflexia bacterium]
MSIFKKMVEVHISIFVSISVLVVILAIFSILGPWGRGTFSAFANSDDEQLIVNYQIYPQEVRIKIIEKMKTMISVYNDVTQNPNKYIDTIKVLVPEIPTKKLLEKSAIIVYLEMDRGKIVGKMMKNGGEKKDSIILYTIDQIDFQHASFRFTKIDDPKLAMKDGRFFFLRLKDQFSLFNDRYFMKFLSSLYEFIDPNNEAFAQGDKTAGGLMDPANDEISSQIVLKYIESLPKTNAEDVAFREHMAINLTACLEENGLLSTESAQGDEKASICNQINKIPDSVNYASIKGRLQAMCSNITSMKHFKTIAGVALGLAAAAGHDYRSNAEEMGVSFSGELAAFLSGPLVKPVVESGISLVKKYSEETMASRGMARTEDPSGQRSEEAVGGVAAVVGVVMSGVHAYQEVSAAAKMEKARNTGTLTYCVLKKECNTELDIHKRLQQSSVDGGGPLEHLSGTFNSLHNLRSTTGPASSTDLCEVPASVPVPVPMPEPIMRVDGMLAASKSCLRPRGTSSCLAARAIQKEGGFSGKLSSRADNMVHSAAILELNGMLSDKNSQSDYYEQLSVKYETSVTSGGKHFAFTKPQDRKNCIAETAKNWVKNNGKECSWYDVFCQVGSVPESELNKDQSGNRELLEKYGLGEIGMSDKGPVSVAVSTTKVAENICQCYVDWKICLAEVKEKLAKVKEEEPGSFGEEYSPDVTGDSVAEVARSYEGGAIKKLGQMLSGGSSAGEGSVWSAVLANSDQLYSTFERLIGKSDYGQLVKAKGLDSFLSNGAERAISYAQRDLPITDEKFRKALYEYLGGIEQIKKAIVPESSKQSDKQAQNMKKATKDADAKNSEKKSSVASAESMVKKASEETSKKVESSYQESRKRVIPKNRAGNYTRARNDVANYLGNVKSLGASGNAAKMRHAYKAARSSKYIDERMKKNLDRVHSKYYRRSVGPKKFDSHVDNLRAAYRKVVH